MIITTVTAFERLQSASPIDRVVTLAIYDTLRAISRITRRYADRLSRTVDIDALRGYHGFPPSTDVERCDVA